MRSFVLCCLIAAAVAAPPPASSGGAEVLSYENNNIGTGDYKFEYVQNDGIKGEAQGELKNGGSENAFISVKGSFEWVGPDGVNYKGDYIADENGYHPTYTQGQGGVIPDEVIKGLNSK